MPFQCRRRWSNIDPPLVQCLEYGTGFVDLSRHYVLSYLISLWGRCYVYLCSGVEYLITWHYELSAYGPVNEYIPFLRNIYHIITEIM